MGTVDWTVQRTTDITHISQIGSNFFFMKKAISFTIFLWISNVKYAKNKRLINFLLFSTWIYQTLVSSILKSNRIPAVSHHQIVYFSVLRCLRKLSCIYIIQGNFKHHYYSFANKHPYIIDDGVSSPRIRIFTTAFKWKLMVCVFDGIFNAS